MNGTPRSPAILSRPGTVQARQLDENDGSAWVDGRAGRTLAARLLVVPLRQPLPTGTAQLLSEHGPIIVLLWGRAEVGEHVVVDVPDSGERGRLYPSGSVVEPGPEALLEVTNTPKWLARHG